MLVDLQNSCTLIEEEKIFLGGPKPAFTRVGRNQLIALLDVGLTPDCKVLDIGCGCLRGGWWLINFLSRGCYFGIEPNVDMLSSGIRHLLTEPLVNTKRPRFAHNDDFDFGVFGIKFDYFVARSIWSHAAPGQIEKMLNKFVEYSTSEGCFVTSYRETDESIKQYSGNTWVGRSHTSDLGGMIEYTYEWLESICHERNLVIKRMHMDFGQRWIRIFKASSKTQAFVNKEPASGRILG